MLCNKKGFFIFYILFLNVFCFLMCLFGNKGINLYIGYQGIYDLKGNILFYI